MKDSAYKISLDINEHGSQVALKAKQSDTGRKIHISLRAGGTPYTIAEDCYAVFEATKPDGSILYNACTIEGNEIIYEFTEQTCAAVGRSRCEIKLYGLDDKLITSPRFALLVDGTVYPDGRVVSTDEFSALTQMVSDTLEAKKATSEAAEAANTATENANEATENANKATESAVTATGVANDSARSAQDSSIAANQAAQNATEAAALAADKADRANLSAQLADDMALAADVAASKASQAAGEANAAADKAIRASNACMVIGKASGENISLGDAIEQNLVGCRIFGKTTQDGTPTPDAPVDLVSVGGSGSITVNVAGANEAQSMTVATPNGLPGIPVTSGGNYVDANGQQWICDEKDYGRGVYVQRVLKKTFVGSNSEGWSQGINAVDGIERYLTPDNPVNLTRMPLCSHFECVRNSAYNLNKEALCYGSEYYYYDFAVATARCPDLASWKAYLAGQHASGTPITVYHLLDTPIETPLSEEELVAYAALHTYRDNTTVSNDAGAYMELEYVMDAKKYIDSQISTGIIEARVG